MTSKDRRNSEELQVRVEDALRVLLPWEAVRIGVSARESAVMLSGTVTTKAEHAAVVETALAAGATAIADHVDVSGDDSHPSDLNLAVAVRRALTHSQFLQDLTALPTVRRGHVTLTGEACTADDREKAGKIAQHVHGVVSVDNRLTVRAESPAPTGGQ